MRLFIAINLSKEQTDELLRVQSLFITKDVHASFAKEFHLTLRFLGEFNEEDLERLISSLDKVRFNKFTIKLSNIGAFPSKTSIKVLWVGLEKNHSLSELYNNIGDAIKKFKIKEDHAFHPHITLARIKQIDNKSEFIKTMENTKVNQINAEISSFTLYKSTLTPDGALHEVVKEFN